MTISCTVSIQLAFYYIHQPCSLSSKKQNAYTLFLELTKATDLILTDIVS